MGDSFKPFNTDSSSVPDSFQPLSSNGIKLFGGAPPQTTGAITDSVLNKAIDISRPFVGNAVGDVTGALAAPLGPIASFGAETQGYSLVDSLMKMLKPDYAKNNNGYAENLLDSEKDALVNAVGGRVMGALFRGGNALFGKGPIPEIYKFAPTTSQVLEAHGFHALGTVAKFAEDFGASGAKAEALDRAGGQGFTQALKFSNALNGRQSFTNSDPVKLAGKIRETLEQGLYPNPGSSPTTHLASQEALDTLSGGKNPFAKIDTVIQDPDRLEKVLATGQINGVQGVKKDLQSYQFMRMVNDATTKDASGAIRIDPNKLSKAWSDPDMNTSFDTLYGKVGKGGIRDDITNFFKNIATTQDKMHSYPVAKQLRFLGAGFAIPTALITGNVTGAESALGTIAGLYIPTAVVGNLLTKPTTARILTAMAGGESLGASQKVAARVLTNALQGTSIALINSQGQKKWGSLQSDKNGGYQFVENK